MTIPQLEAAAKAFLRLLDEYPHFKSKLGERFLDLAFFALLEGRFAKMSRQYQVRVPSRKYPYRIDFRHGTSNPVFIEFAARPKKGGAQLRAPQNSSELRKLARLSHGRCVLLLLDAHVYHYAKEDLRPEYMAIKSAGGRYYRHAVTILYVHRSHSFRMEWSRKNA